MLFRPLAAWVHILFPCSARIQCSAIILLWFIFPVQTLRGCSIRTFLPSSSSSWLTLEGFLARSLGHLRLEHGGRAGTLRERAHVTTLCPRADVGYHKGTRTKKGGIEPIIKGSVSCFAFGMYGLSLVVAHRDLRAQWWSLLLPLLPSRRASLHTAFGTGAWNTLGAPVRRVCALT